MSTIRVHRVPTTVEHTESGRVRWCFNCRKHSAGVYSFHVPDARSYYEPHWSYACDNCGEDARLGFGWGWIDGTPGPDERDRVAA